VARFPTRSMWTGSPLGVGVMTVRSINSRTNAMASASRASPEASTSCSRRKF